MRQYLDLCNRVINEGKWVVNERTGKRCLTVIGATLRYNMSEMRLPILTTKKVAMKKAIAEMLGYVRGYDNAANFRELGTDTWDANANENQAWLANPHRKGVDDMGRVYGVQGRFWRTPEGETVDQLAKIVNDLSQGKDDRREILSFWNPGEMHLGCLAPCLYEHVFSILDGTLYLTSTQRSDDLPLGHAFNQIQVAWFLAVMAQITGLKPGMATHNIINAHIYENQLEIMKTEQLHREPRELPKLVINPAIKSLRDLETWVTPADFTLEGYDPHPAIKYPFSV